MNKLLTFAILAATIAHLGLSAETPREAAARRSYEYFCTGDEATRREHAVANIVMIDDKRKEEIIAQRAKNCERMRPYFEKVQ